MAKRGPSFLKLTVPRVLFDEQNLFSSRLNGLLTYLSTPASPHAIPTFDSSAVWKVADKAALVDVVKSVTMRQSCVFDCQEQVFIFNGVLYFKQQMSKCDECEQNVNALNYIWHKEYVHGKKLLTYCALCMILLKTDESVTGRGFAYFSNHLIEHHDLSMELKTISIDFEKGVINHSYGKHSVLIKQQTGSSFQVGTKGNLNLPHLEFVDLVKEFRSQEEKLQVEPAYLQDDKIPRKLLEPAVTYLKSL